MNSHADSLTTELMGTLADVALILGHTSPNMTRKHYVRARFSRMVEAMAKIAGRVTWD